jgi:hypothetical protein
VFVDESGTHISMEIGCALGLLVHLQYRFRVVSYSSGHENSDLCTFAFGKGA